MFCCKKNKIFAVNKTQNAERTLCFGAVLGSETALCGDLNCAVRGSELKERTVWVKAVEVRHD